MRRPPPRHLPAGPHPGGAAHRRACAIFVALTAVALLLEQLGPGERLSFVVTGAAVPRRAASCSAGRKVVADEAGVTVVNLASTRRLAWAEILRVNLRPGDPWVYLDLADGTSLPVIGIQPGIAREQAIRDARALRALAEQLRHGRRAARAEPADYSDAGGAPPHPRTGAGPCDPRSDSLQRWTDRPVVPAPSPATGNGSPPASADARRHRPDSAGQALFPGSLRSRDSPSLRPGVSPGTRALPPPRAGGFPSACGPGRPSWRCPKARV